MDVMYLIRNRRILGEDEFVAVFDDREKSDGFVNRNNHVKGEYEVIEVPFNPNFVSEKGQPFYVMLDVDDQEMNFNVVPIVVLEEEAEAATDSVAKVDGDFHMMLYAKDELQAKEIAKRKYEEMQALNEWDALKDVND